MFLPHIKLTWQAQFFLAFLGLILVKPNLTFAKAQIEIKVEEKKEASLDTTAHTIILTPKEIQGASQTVPQLLERAGGVQLKRYGGLDDFAQVSIRGSTTDQVLIYLNGILLNSADGGFTDLSFVSIDQIEKIEIYKGGAPGKIADATPGGVIMITTKKPLKKPAHLIKNALGSFWTYRGHIERSETLKNWNYLFSLSHSRSQGDFSFLDDRGTRNNPNDDRITTRKNNDFQAYDTAATFGFDLKNIQLKVHENFYLKKQGIPGLGNFTSTSARLNRLRNLFSLNFNTKHSSKRKSVWRGDLFFDFAKSRFKDPKGEIGLGTQDNDDDTLRAGPALHWTYPLHPQHLLNSFVAYRAEVFKPTNRTAAKPEGPTSARHMMSVGLEDEMSFFHEKWFVSPSARFQTFINHLKGSDPSFASNTPNNTLTDIQLSAKLGMRVTPWPSISFRTNVYRGFREPTFGELFGDRGTLVGNPDLKPEESLNFDIGLDYRQIAALKGIKDFQLGFTFFYNNIDHLIQFLQTSQLTAKAQNLNEARILGGELNLSATLIQKWKWNVSYIYQRAKDVEKGSPTYQRWLPGRPKHQWFLETELKLGIFKPFSTLQIIDDNFLDAQNLLKVDKRTLLSSGLQIDPSKKVRLIFETKNLLNDRIVDIAGFPLPGRSYWGELILNL